MPTNLTPNAANGATNPVVVAPATGDARTAASIVAGLQPLTDRDAYLAEVIFSDGVPTIATVASIAALQAIDTTSAVPDGSVRLVDGSDVIGAFRFFASASSGAVPYQVIVPTTGAGRWIRTDAGVWGVANGLATLSSSSRLVQLPPNAIVQQATVDLAHDAHFTTGSFVSGPTVTPSAVAAGDVFTVAANGYAVLSGSGTPVGALQLVAIENSTTTVLWGAVVDNAWFTAGTPMPFAATAQYTAAGTTGVVFALQGRITGGGTSTSVRSLADSNSSCALSFQQVRP